MQDSVVAPSLREYLDSQKVTIFSDSTIQTAQGLLDQKLLKSTSKNVNEHDHFVSALIIAEVILSESKEHTATTLKDILNALNTSMGKIVKTLDIFMQTITLEERPRNQLFLLCKDTIYFLMFFGKYEKLAQETLPSTLDYSFQFGWLFFTHNKIHFLSNNPHDYERNLYLLLCSFAFFISIHPQRKKDCPALATGSNNSKESMELDSNFTLPGGETVEPLIYRVLHVLCENESTDISTVETFFTEQFWPHIQSLDFLEPTNIFQLWLSPEHVQRNVEALSKEQDKNVSPFRLDFRDVQREKSAAVEFSSVAVNSAKRSLGSAFDDTSKTPSPRSFNNTPPAVIPSEDVISWLESILPSPTQDEIHPSDKLERYFTSCLSNPRPAIDARFRVLTSTPLSSIQQRKTQQLYYRLLEAMLSEEEIRLQKSDFSILLHHEVFHHSLLACCLEIIAFAHQIQECLFPESVKLFKVTAFEVSKLIDNVFRYEKNMPSSLQHHLKIIDQKILQSLLWREGSPVFELLRRGGKGQEQYLQQKFQERIYKCLHNGQSSGILLGSSTPVKNTRAQLYSPAKTPGPSFRSVSLEIIFRKVVDLLLQRMNSLLKELGLLNAMEYSMTIIVQIITQQYYLLQNRHIDQIMICTVYGVARAMKIEITFRKILQFYKMQWQADSTVWKKVLLKDGEEKDVIEFYNQIYIVEMEPHLLKFQTKPTQIPITSGTNAVVLNSPVKVTTTGSPLSRTPRKRGVGMVYNVGQSPSKDLKQYNEFGSPRNVNVAPSSNNRKKVTRRLFDDEEPRPAKKQKTTNDSETDSTPLAEAITSLTNNALTSSGPSILRMPK